jgi:hypothetical protein
MPADPRDAILVGDWELVLLSHRYFSASRAGVHMGGLIRCVSRKFAQSRYWWADGQTVGGPFVGRDAVLEALGKRGGWHDA